MAEHDACQWSVVEVCRYLRHQLRNDISSIPYVTGLDTEDLATKFESDDVNGFALLTTIDLLALRDEFGLASRSARAAVIYAIRHLRRTSPTFALLEESPSAPQASSTIACSPREATPQGPRKAEHFVADATGRKRRKLNIGAIVTEPLKEPQVQAMLSDASPVREISQRPSYLPDKAVPVEEMFYGNTPMGEVIDLEMSDNDSDTISFVAQGPIHPGLVKSVGRYMLHFLKASEQKDIMYRGKPAIALHPYRAHVKRHRRKAEFIPSKDKPASATVFQHQDDGVISAIRADASMLPYQQQDSFKDPDPLNTTYCHILERWGNMKDDEMIPDDDGSISITSSLEDEMVQEELERDKLTRDNLTIEQARAIINNYIDTITEAWISDKQSSLETNHAWSLWRRHRGHRTIRDSLIKSTEAIIGKFQSRLMRYINEILREQWSSETSLRKQCRCLEVTVEDIAKETWRLGVLKRTDEPQHTARRNQARRNQTQAKLLDLEMVDRADELMVEDENAINDVAQTPVEADQSNLNYRETIEDTEFVNEGRPKSGPRFSTPGSNPEQSSKLSAMEMALSQTAVCKQEDSSDDELPSPSKFNEMLRTSQSARREANPTPDYIVLSSSSPSPSLNLPERPVTPRESPSKKKALRARKNHLSDHPLDATLEEIEGWQWGELEADLDKEKILIKLVYELQPGARQRLLAYISMCPPSACFKDVQLACLEFPADPQLYHEGSEQTQARLAISLAARLYLCYHHEVRYYLECPADECEKFRANYDDIELWKWHTLLKNALQKAERMISVTNDDNEEDDKDEVLSPTKTPHKVRKRPIKKNKTSENLRRKALARQAQFVQRESDDGQLSQMVAGGSSVGEEVAIFAPEDRSQHIYLNKHLASMLKPHQIEGIKFMWRELTVPDEDDGQGCLLAHTMGLGKTAQAIALLVTIADTLRDEGKRGLVPASFADNRILVICPPVLIGNWRKELSMWDPEHKLGNTYSIESVIADKGARFAEIRAWAERGGILLIGYSMLNKFVNGRMQARPRAKAATEEVNESIEEVTNNAHFTIEEQDEAAGILLNTPSIVIADEAHMLKNEKSKIALAASQFATHRRIALTGSPMSNNTQEIYALISWVAPKYLGSAEEFRAHYAEPIAQGLYSDSTHAEKRKSLKKLAALNRIIGPKLNRADITVLKGSIKQKVEFVISIPLTEVQSIAYTKFVTHILSGNAMGKMGQMITQAKLFGWLAILKLLCNHPSVFREKLTEDPETAKKGKYVRTKDTIMVPEGVEEQVPGDEHISALDINDAMVEDILRDLPQQSMIEDSYKAQMVLKIIELSVQAGDKVLLFSHSIPSLNYLTQLLKEHRIRFGRIDGSMNQQKRAEILQNMDKGDYDVLLVSTRAGGLGLNIQSANRVIIFDFGFNPTWEEQAIGRAYRLGQKKAVFVYRFVAGGTFESMLYNKALFKTSLASRVVDKKNPERNTQRQLREWLFAPEPVAQEDVMGEMGKDVMIMDKLLEQHAEAGSSIRAIKTMETLQRDANDEPLTEEEQREVEEEIRLSALMMGGGASGGHGRNSGVGGGSSSTSRFTNGFAEFIAAMTGDQQDLRGNGMH